MKKSAVILLVCVLLIGFASAGWFGDLLNKIFTQGDVTGQVTSGIACNNDNDCSSDRYCQCYICNDCDCTCELKKCFTSDDCALTQFCSSYNYECKTLAIGTCVDDIHENCAEGQICNTTARQCINVSASAHWELSGSNVDTTTIISGQSKSLTMVLNTNSSTYNSKTILLTLKEYDNATQSDNLRSLSGIVNSDGILNVKVNLTETDVINSGNESVSQFYFTDNYSLIVVPAYLNATFVNIPIVITSITPTEATAGFPVEFVINTTDMNLTSFKWNFGDNQTSTSTSKKINYTYVKKGNFTLEVTAIGADGNNYSEEFNVVVGAPTAQLSEKINKSLSDLKKFKDALSEAGGLIESKLTGDLGVATLESNLESIQAEFNKGNEDNYFALLSNVSNLKIPVSLSLGNENTESLAFSDGNININAVEKVGFDEKELSSADKVGISVWANDNVAGEISYQVVTAEYDDSTSDDFTFFTIELTNGGNEEATFFFKELAGVEFDGDELDVEGNYYYKTFSDDATISFAVPGEVSVDDLSYFASPPLSSIEVVNVPTSGSGDEGGFSWFLIIVIILVIAILALAGYLIYNKYKKKPTTNQPVDRNKFEIKATRLPLINKKGPGGVNQKPVISSQKTPLNNNQGGIKFPKVNKK